ncbi:hypothetical protein EV11_0839 [Prochlorococcus sp. SS52]|nr:hypothetical protein EV04_0657 [Prochlorococcus marinus str. LG]KGG21334.1 hypothetical protein EV08_0742 [Prochlorococcus marinus str. SS2]KGG36467.1 hypothetical protein EV11_0839 [Prochlorococcus sp. SS52]
MTKVELYSSTSTDLRSLIESRVIESASFYFRKNQLAQ